MAEIVWQVGERWLLIHAPWIVESLTLGANRPILVS